MIQQQRVLDNRTEDHLAGTTDNGIELYIGLMKPPMSETIGRNPHLLSLIREICSRIKLSPDTTHFQYDMGRQVGYLENVSTKPEDVVFYAKQIRQKNFTRFIKNRRTESTSIVSLRLEWFSDSRCSIVEAWIGPLPVPLPDVAQASSASHSYWQSHAVAYNGQPIQASTVTKSWPF